MKTSPEIITTNPTFLITLRIAVVICSTSLIVLCYFVLPPSSLFTFLPRFCHLWFLSFLFSQSTNCFVTSNGFSVVVWLPPTAFWGDFAGLIGLDMAYKILVTFLWLELLTDALVIEMRLKITLWRASTFLCSPHSCLTWGVNPSGTKPTHQVLWKEVLVPQFVKQRRKCLLCYCCFIHFTFKLIVLSTKEKFFVARKK